jgi:hypothetical protein
MSGGKFVRVVHRQGWDVELVGGGEKRNFGTRDEAVAFAEGEQPDWIELGEVVPAAGEVPQHHRWRTLRRRPDGSYAEVGLNWGGPAGPKAD